MIPSARMPEHPGRNPACPDCSGAGFRVTPQGEVARATPCACITAKPCPRCQDTGWVRATGDRQGPVRRCDCHHFRQRLARFDEATIPARLGQCTFDSFVLDKPDEQRDAYTASLALSAGFKPGAINRGVVLWGQVGRGKTHLLVSAVRKLTLEKGVRVRFIEFSHLLSALKGRFDRGQGAAALLDQLVEVEVLAIDELGKGMLTEFELTVIDELVSRRYNAARTILATTNYRPGPATGIGRPNLADRRAETQPSLSDRVGERVFSRLAEMCDLRRLGGADHRQDPSARW